MVNLPGSKDYYTTIIDAALVRSILLRLSQHNHSHIMIYFCIHQNLSSLVHICTIKEGTEFNDDLLLRTIEQWFRFCCHWRVINTALVYLITLTISQQIHPHLIILFSNHHNIYYFTHISSIKAGREVVEDFPLRIIKRRF